MWIYKITNKINGKSYIGQASDPYNRWAKHLSRAKNGSQMFAIHHAMKKYGVENFDFDVIDETTKEKVDDLEKHYIREYNSYEDGYNLTEGGMVSVITEETKKKMSKALLGNQHAKGYKQSEEQIRKRVESTNKTKAAKKAAGYKRKHPERKCPHCSKVGRGAGMTRYHFDNCKLKPKG